MEIRKVMMKWCTPWWGTKDNLLENGDWKSGKKISGNVTWRRILGYGMKLVRSVSSGTFYVIGANLLVLLPENLFSWLVWLNIC